MAAALLRALSLPFVLKSPATSAAAGPAEAAAETDQLAEDDSDDSANELQNLPERVRLKKLEFAEATDAQRKQQLTNDIRKLQGAQLKGLRDTVSDLTGHLRQLLFDRSVGTEQSLSAPANNSTVDYLQFWQGLVRQGRVHSVNELQSVVPLDNDPLTDELANLFTAACESGCSGQAFMQRVDDFISDPSRRDQFGRVHNTREIRFLSERGYSGQEALLPDFAVLHGTSKFTNFYGEPWQNGELRFKLRSIGQVDAVTLVEVKSPDKSLQPSSKEEEHNYNLLVGQTIAYAFAILKTNPWRAKCLCTITNGWQAVVVEAFYDAKRVLHANVFYSVDTSALLTVEQRCLVAARCVLSFLTANRNPEQFGWVQPRLTSQSSGVGTELRFTELLGKGATSRVYLGEGLDFPRRRVAVKVFCENVNATAIEFAAEVQVLEKLQANGGNAGFPIFEGTIGGRPETLVTGPVGKYTIKSRQKADAKYPSYYLETETAVRADTIGAVVKLVQACHSKSIGFIHRDLRTPNILLQDDLRPLIIDWGFATRRGGRDQSFKGAAYYLPSNCKDYAAVQVDLQILVRVCYIEMLSRPNQRAFQMVYSTRDYWANVEQSDIWQRHWLKADKLAQARKYDKLARVLEKLLSPPSSSSE